MAITINTAMSAISVISAILKRLTISLISAIKQFQLIQQLYTIQQSLPFMPFQEDGKTYQTVTIWIVTIWKQFIRWLISGMKIFQNSFGMKYIQMVTGKWYENYSDRTQIDLVWTSFIRWLVIGMKISYCHQMNCHHLKYPINLTL